jgi:hypothetical protein
MRCVPAVINAAQCNLQLCAILPLPLRFQNGIQLIQRLKLLRVAINLKVPQMPPFLATAPSPYRHDQPFGYRAAAALHVNASGQH